MASYSRSGNTMLRFILAEILSGVPSSFNTMQRIVPEMGLQVNAAPIIPGGGRMIKTHEPYRREYKRAIYMIRDVRNVMLSCYSRETSLGVIHTTLDDYVRPFLQGSMQHYGAWHEHVDGWLNSPIARSGDLLVMRFEDMRKDLEGSVALSLEFLGKKVDPEIIQAAIRNNSIEKMREMEDHSTLPKSRLEEGRQIGKGSIEGWRRKLTQQQLEIVDEYAGEMLARLHYPSSLTPADQPKQTPESTPPTNSAKTPVRPIVMVRAQDRASQRQEKDGVSAARALRIRLGGKIANSFCWYSY
jgi:hypothetical protein